MFLTCVGTILSKVHVILFNGSKEMIPRQWAICCGLEQVEAVMSSLRAVC